MANQQVGVNMKFTADTSQAKAQLQDLQSSLTKIMNVSRKNDPTLGFSKEIQNAINLTSELKTSLENATNVKTGQLDLSKFNDSLVKNKRTLKDYQEALTSLGPAGNQAFSNLASSIMKAEIPLKRTNKLLTDFAVTMKNTAKWQISSNIMHGLEGSIKSAYGYAQDLNRSLNDIRIVTGASVNEMARFAEQANKSARALSTTTTDYTKASLIYYQQGLSDAEVQERTDITIKMANAAGQSAQIISDQMTAVWNNFDNGSKSLEYYADVMTALGAATASSTDEIAAGLEKFAAVSETVGLSYEYATAALATVTDKTRQSADVVGTAFKTMFARIQGLKLGETLEDGTDLNQYSEALLAVGINIKDANGELKDMDNILNEMAAVWEKLNRDEQVALAQKVAGVRQYNQLMSLMENWDAMEVNLEIANNSEGELQKQADIYAESWEAATDRVKAATESIYQTLINDEFFIDLTNALEKVLVGVKKLMDSMGGLPGVLTLVGSIATNVFSKQLADGFDNLIYRVRMSTAEGRKEIESLKQEASELLVAEWIDRDTTSGQIAGDAYREQGQLSGILLANAEKLSAEEQKQVQYLMDQHSSLVSQVVQSGEALEIEQKRAKALERRMIAEAQLAAGEKSTHKASGVETHRKSLEGVTQLYYDISSISLTGNMEKDAQNFQRLEKIIAGLKNTTVQFGKEGQSAIGLLKEGLKSGTLSASTLDNVLLKLEKQQVISMNGLTKALKSCGIEGEQATRMAKELRDQYDNLGVVSAETSEKQTQLGNSTKMVAEKIRGAKGEVATLGTMFASTMSAITSFGFALSSIKGVIDTLNNEDLTFFEKFVSVLTSASMITTSLISVLKTVNEIRKIATAEETKNTLAKTLNTAATWLEVQAQKALNNEMQEGINLKKSMSGADLADAKKTGKKVSVKVADKAADGVKKAGEASAGTTGATISLSAAFSRFTSALGTAASAAAKFIPIIAAITAALGALTYMVHYTIEEYNKDATAAEKAEAAAKDLAEAYSQTKSKYEEMISSMENYKTARDGLNSLAKGTQEYRDQLNKANEEALKLIETLGLIKGSGYDIINGEIIINKDSEDYQTKTQEFEYSVQKTQAASYIANAESEKATAKSNQTTLARTQNKLDFYGTFENNRIDQLTQQYKKMGAAAFDASNLISLGFDTANEKYIDSVKKQVATNIEASDSMENAMELASQAILNLDKDIEKSSQKETLFAMGENAYNLTYATEKSNITEQMTQEKWQFGIASDEQKDIWEEYKKTNKELQGLTDLKVTNFRADGSVEYEYTEYDDDGKKTTKTDEVSSEVIAITLANERTADKLIANSDTLNSLANRLVADETISKEFASFTADQNLNDLTYKELSSIEMPESFEALRDKVAETFSEEELSALGYNSAEAYATAFILQYDNTMSQWKGLENFNNYSLGEAQSLSHISTQTGQSADEVTGYYDELNEEEKSIFLTLDFDENKSKENWDRAIANIKEEKIEIQIEAKTSKAASEYGLDADQLNDVAKAFSDMDEIMGDNTATTEEIAEAASDAAVRYVRLQDAVIDLSENYEDYKGVLTDIQDSSSDVDKAMILNSKNGKALKSSLAGLIGTTEDLINADLISAIDPKDFKAAATGDEAAIEKIRGAFIDVQAAAIDTKNVLIDSVDTDEEITQAANNFKTMMAGLDEGATIDIDNSPFLQALIQSSIAAGDTEADIINKLSGFDIDVDTVSFHDSLESAKAAAEACGGDVVEALSYSTDTEVETNEVDKQGSELSYNETITATPITKENEVLETEGFLGLGGTTTKTLTTTHYEMDKQINPKSVPTSEKETSTNVTQTAKQGKGKSKYAVVGGAKKSVGSRVSPSTSRTAGNNLSKGGGGGSGGGAKPKKAQPTKKSEIVKRYKEQDDQLDDLKRIMDNTSESFDKLYGEDKVKAIDKLIEVENNYRNVLKEKRNEAKDALDEDRKALDKAASDVSVKFEYDAEGNITNYTEQMEALYSRLREIEKAAGSEWTESEQEQIDALKEKIKTLEEAQTSYEETRELIEDLSDELTSLAGKPAMPLIKSDTIDIYKEIIDALDDIEARLERISKRANDRLGKERLTYFGKYLDASKDKLSQLNAEIEKNTTDIKENKSYLNRVGKLLDFNQKIKYDDKGNIANYDELTDILWQRIFKAQEKAKKDGKITNAEQQGIDALIADAEMWRQAAEKYTDAVEYKEDLTLEKQELTDKVIMLPTVTNDFLDIYKEVDDVLDDIGHELDYIAEQSERLTGSEKIAALKEMVDLEKERLFYIQNEQLINVSDKMEKRSALETAVKKLGIGMTLAYDENGNVTNYNEIMSTYKQSYNTAYAKAMADGALTAGEKEWLEQFKEDGEYIQEYFDQYNDALEQGENLAEDALEAMQNIEDYSLDAINYTVELNIEANERDLAFIDYQLSQLEDQAFSTAESIALLEQKYLNLSESSSDYENGINSIFQKYIDSKQLTQEDVDKFWQGDASGISWAIFTADEISKINEYSDGIMSVGESMLELRKTLDEAVITSFEEWTAEMQEQLSLFDHYESVINSYNNIIDLVGQKKLNVSNDDRKDYNQLRVNNANNRLSSSKAYFDETTEKIANAEKEKAAAEARLAAAQSSGDENLIKAAEADVKMWGDTLKVMYQENRNAEQQYLADWEAALQASRDAFLAETEMELEAFEEKMAGVYGSFENMQKEFNRQTEKNDRYLQDYEKLYELSKLNRDLSNKMDDTTNLKAKKELAKLQEEILESQKDGVKMSDYDLKFLQKKYDLKLAEIALEEAQNAKTQVRLTKDAEGGYSYTYTADEDSIAKAQQSYEDQLYGIANLSNEYIEQQTSKLLSTQQAFVNDLAEIHKKAAEGQYATTEEYQQALDDCSAYYTEQLAYYGDEIDKAASNNSTIYENDYSNYAGWTVEKIKKTEEDTDKYVTGAGEKFAAEEGFVTSIEGLLPRLQTAHGTATGYVSTMTTEIGSAEEGTGLLGASKKSYEKYSENIDASMSAAGTSLEDFKDNTSKYLLTDSDSVANQSDEARQKIEDMADAVSNLDKTIAYVSNWQKNYSNELQKVIDKTADVITSVGNMNQAIADSATVELQKPAEKPASEGDGKKEDKPASTIENPITEIPAEATCPICKKPLSQCKGHDEKKEEKKCPKCGKKPCKCKEIEAQKKAEEEAKRKAEEEAKRKAAEKKKKQQAAKIAAEATEIIQLVNAGKLGNKRDGWVPAAKEKYSDEAIQLAKDAFNKSKAGAGYDYNYKKALELVKLNTGGYTGAWGPDGKLALLHEKELVLNKEDTENMLKMISMVRDLSLILDIQAYQASLAQLSASQLGVMSSSQGAFQQNVTINAEFPDAVYASEIETALKNLVNSASQFANRKY